MKFTKKQYKYFAFIGGWCLLAIFLYQVDFEEIRLNLKEIGWQFLWVFIVTGIAYGMASTAWLLCFMETPKQVSAAKLFIYRQIGETLSTINPANIIVGESAKIYLLNKEGVGYKDGIASILMSRVLIMLSMIALFIGFPFFLLNTDTLADANVLQYGALGILSILISGFFYVLISEKLYLYRFVKLLGIKFRLTFLKKHIIKTKEINLLLHQFYKKQKAKLILAFLLSLFHWLMGAVEVYLLLYLLNIKTTFFSALLIEIGVTCIKSMGAFIPGQIGIEEYGNKLMLDLLNIGNNGLWLSISILRRTRQIIWLVIGGCLFWIILREEGTKELNPPNVGLIANQS